jgi:hypothetical protein
MNVNQGSSRPVILQADGSVEVDGLVAANDLIGSEIACLLEVSSLCLPSEEKKNQMLNDSATTGTRLQDDRHHPARVRPGREQLRGRAHLVPERQRN